MARVRKAPDGAILSAFWRDSVGSSGPTCATSTIPRWRPSRRCSCSLDSPCRMPCRATPGTSRLCCSQGQPTPGVPTRQSSTDSRPLCIRSPCRCAATATPTSRRSAIGSRTRDRRRWFPRRTRDRTGGAWRAFGLEFVARRVALDHPERVAGLVLEASPTPCAATPDSRSSCSQSFRVWRTRSAPTWSDPS